MCFRGVSKSVVVDLELDVLLYETSLRLAGAIDDLTKLNVYVYGVGAREAILVGRAVHSPSEPHGEHLAVELHNFTHLRVPRRVRPASLGEVRVHAPQGAHILRERRPSVQSALSVFSIPMLPETLVEPFVEQVVALVRLLDEFQR